MKNYHMIIVFIVGLMLSACGGGGATPAAVTQTYTGLYAATGDEAGVASVVGTGDDAVYTYNYQGTPVDVTLDGATPIGGFVHITEDVIGRYIGGTTYSYSRFGVVARNNSFSSSSIAPAAEVPLYVDGEVFYVGQKTSSMPTTGTASYSGYLTTLFNGDFYRNSVSFDVNYGGKTMTGTATVFNQNMELDGTIDGSDFSGDMISGPENPGSYHGSFFGPNAEELGGAGTFDYQDETFGFSFGAKKEEL